MLAGSLAAVTTVIVAVPDLSGRLDAPLVDVAINAAATLVGGAVAILAWVRWRETGAVAALLESAAFVVLTVTNALTLGLVLASRGDVFGLDPAAASPAPAYVWSLARLLAATLLVVGAIGGLRRSRPPGHPVAIAFGPASALLVVAVAVASAPQLGGTTGEGGTGAYQALVLTVLQVAIFAIFFVAAALFRRLYLRDGAVSHAFLAAGLVVAAFSQLHFAMNPVVAIGVVTSGDILRVGFYAILFLGIQAELQSDLAALRRANVDLQRLAEADAARATMTERARLAREIHDGLAQDLWSAKLKAARLTGEEGLPAPHRQLVDEIASAIDSGLADARQAVMALRMEHEGGSFEDVLRRYVADFSDRFGLRPTVDIESAIPPLSPRVEAELLRIAQEALNNVRKHADATAVGLRLEANGDAIRLTVSDNGRGFDPRTRHAGFGLQGMRERAEMIGAMLAVDSRPSDGTRVSVDVPAERRPT